MKKKIKMNFNFQKLMKILINLKEIPNHLIIFNLKIKIKIIKKVKTNNKMIKT